MTSKRGYSYASAVTTNISYDQGKMLTIINTINNNVYGWI